MRMASMMPGGAAGLPLRCVAMIKGLDKLQLLSDNVEM